MSTEVLLSSFLRYYKGKPPREVGNNSHAQLPVLSPEYLRGDGEPELTASAKLGVRLNGGEIVLLWDGSNAGEFFRAKRGLLASTMVAFNFDDTEIEKDYLYYELKRFEPILKSQTSGSGIPHVDKQILLSHRIRKPYQAEQRLISKVLLTVERAIEQTEALIAKYQRIKTGLMQDILTHGIDEHGCLRNPAIHKFKSSTLGRIPEEWEVKLLGSLAEINSGVTLGRQISGENTIELPYLRVANVQDGYLDLTEIKTIRVYRQELQRFRLRVGDVLMNEGGDFDKLGRGTVWRGEIADCLHQNHVFRVRPNQLELSPDYLAIYSASPFGKKFFVLSSKQSTNLASINSTQLKGFPIPCPPRQEQDRIAGVCETFNSVELLEKRRLSKLNALKTGLMQDLLTGKVSVEPLLNSKRGGNA